jgi:hypothetical protein
VAVDGFLGVDGLISHGGVDVVVPGDQLGDVRRHSVHETGDEDPAEVMRGESQRPAARVGHAGAVQGVVEELADGRAADRAGLAAEAALEQQWYRRVPYAFVVVVGDGQRHGAVLVTDPADDGGEHVGELGPDDQEPFFVGLGRGDVQQRDQLPAGRQPVLDQAVMGQLGEFLDPDAFSRGPFLVAWCCASNSFSGVSRRVFQGVVHVTDSSYCCSGR